MKRGRGIPLPSYRRMVVLLAGILLLIGPVTTRPMPRAHAATISVTTCDKPSLDAAISGAQSGDTITFACSGTITDTLQITTTLTLDATGQSVTICETPYIPNYQISITSSGSLTLNGLTLNGLCDGYWYGMGVYNGGTFILTNGAIINNTNSNGVAPAFGGGIYNDHGTVILTNSTISQNAAAVGGGIYNWFGSVTLVNSTVSYNWAESTGAGIYTYGEQATVTLINSTISNNRTSGVGAGMDIRGSMVSLTNSTVSDNGDEAPSPIIGGGIVNEMGGVVGTVALTNTILAGNSARIAHPDCVGPLTSGGHNLVGVGDYCGLTSEQNGDQVGTAASPLDPQLGPLQDNGGPTWTQALTFTSPAVDVVPLANLGNLTTDQRGQPRPDDGESLGDIGAYELQGTPPPTDTPTSTSTDTSTPTSTSTATSTPTGTSTTTPTATVTSTGTPALLTVTATGTNMPTASATSTATPTSTPSATPTPSPTSTATATATSTSTATVNPTRTATATTSVLALSATRTPTAAPTRAALTPPRSARRTSIRTQKKGAPRYPRVPLAVHLALLTAPNTRLLSTHIQTVPYARVYIIVQVLATRTVVIGAGRARHRVTLMVIVYRVSTVGTADRHGRFTGHLRVSYAPRRITPAQVIVTVHQGSTTTSSTLRLMIEPQGKPHSRPRR